MKTLTLQKVLAPVLGIVLALLAGAQQANAYTTSYGTDSVTYSDVWSIGRDISISGNTDTYTGLDGSFDTQLSLAYFNLSGKVLTGVTLSYTYNGLTLSSTLSAVSSPATVSTASNKLTTTVSSSDIDTLLSSPGISSDSVLKSASVSNASVTSSSGKSINLVRMVKTDTVISSTDSGVLSAFTQAGTFGLQTESDIQLNYSANNYVKLSTKGTDTGTVSITYTYTAPVLVPEPTTWAMLVGGIGMLVVGQRMRRRSA